MFMFLPFLIALCAAVGVLRGWRSAALACWLLLMVVSVLWLRHHATDPLNLTF
ncbi:MAG: DUF5993 family protein [Burkholderiaceae bacterium]